VACADDFHAAPLAPVADAFNEKKNKAPSFLEILSTSAMV